MIGIRAKLILFMSSLVIIIGTLSCLFFLIHAKRQQKEALKSFGTSLVMMLAQDIEVKHALRYSQPAFLDAPIQRIKALDREEEIGYLRISNIQSVLVEEKAPWMNIDIKEIPTRRDSQNDEILLTDCMLPSSPKAFYDFSLPVLEKQTFSEEAFAAQVLEEISVKTRQHTLGFIQIGLSPHKLNKRIHTIIWRTVIPMGLIIIFGGICITVFLTKYIVSPLQQMASVTLDIARGDLTRTVEVYSKDEIGQLSMNFNQMTRSLKTSYDDLKQEIAERKRTGELLKYRARIEELVATISTNFINLAPNEVDVGINCALKMIGEFAGVDRSYIFLYSDGEEKMDNTHEWCAEGIQPQRENLKGVPVKHFPWGMEKLRRFETIHAPRVSDLPDFASAERELQQSQDVQSFVIVPMIYGGSLVGLLGFDSVRKETTWTSEDIAMLKMVAEIFVNALEHKRMEEMLRKANTELEMRVHERTIELSKANELLKEEIAEHKKAKDELRKYEILISQMSDLAYICDAQGNIVFVNPTFEKLTSRKPEEFLRRSFAPLFDEENLKKAMDAYTMTLKGESPQFELFFKDTGILCEYKNLPLRDENGNIIGIIGTARDITERQRMIDALRQAKEYAENLIETANVMVVGLDVMGNIQIFNRAAEEITGYKKVEVHGKNWFEIIVPRSKHPYAWQEFTRWQSGGQLTRTFENPIFTKAVERDIFRGRTVRCGNKEKLRERSPLGSILPSKSG
ncbi:MAG: PAS domain S-box protein [Candidatus Brocadia sp.]